MPNTTYYKRAKKSNKQKDKYNKFGKYTQKSIRIRQEKLANKNPTPQPPVKQTKKKNKNKYKR